MSYLLILAGSLFLGSAFQFFKYFPKYRIIQNTPTSKLRSAAQGVVELDGKLEMGDDGLQMSPLTGRACVWYHCKVAENTGKNSRVIYEYYSQAPLYFVDDTGYCLIFPAGAEIKATFVDTWTSNTFNPEDRTTSENLIKTIANTLKGENGQEKPRYSFYEERFELGDFLYVLGELKTVHPKEQVLQLEELQKEIIQEWRENFDALITRFDKNKDDILDPKEWEMVRFAAQLEAEKRRKDSTSLPSENHIYKPKNKFIPYILSTDLENRLLATLGWKTKLYGSLSTIGAVSMIITIFKLFAQ